MSEGRSIGVRAVVDRQECFGFAFCIEALPEVFSLGEDGFSVAADVDADEAALSTAADDCPRAAITLIRRADEDVSPRTVDRPPADV